MRVEPLAPAAPSWFRDPAPAFRPAVFWFWHRVPTEAEIVRQIADMLAKGVGRAMIQARRALPLETYLSPPYLEAYRFAAREALKQGLRLTIYDEYGWMSGHGGGRTVRGADHLRERHLFWTSGIARGKRIELKVSNIRSPFLDFLGDAGRSWIYENGAPVWGDWTPVLAVSHPETSTENGGVRNPPAHLAVTADGDRACRIAVELDGAVTPGTTVTAFVSARCLSSRLVNYLLPEAAERFVETVYAPLAEAAGRAADGFFFDHPYAGFYVWDERGDGGLGNSILWDARDAAPSDGRQLLSLAGDVGPRTAALRAEFLEAYARRMHESFFGTLSRWAASKGMGFTGHELLTHVGAWGLQEGLKGFDPRAMPGVDYFGIDAFRSETAVDAADYAPQLAAKLGDSVARAHGRKRCIVEQYSTGREWGAPALAGQWGLTAERFRAQGIRHLLLGARQILLHAYNVDDGQPGDGLLSPRFDFPPAFNFEPWWDDFPLIAAELSRLSAFLEEGDPVRPVALLYPLETIRAESGAAPPCGEHFGWWAEALARAGLGYDVVDERTLPGSLDGGTKYEALVLPAVSALASGRSAAAMLAFARSGGRLLASGPLPQSCRNPRGDAACAALAAEIERSGGWLADARAADVAGMVDALPRRAPDAAFEEGPSWTAVAVHGRSVRVAAFNDRSMPRVLRLRLGEPAAKVELWDPAGGDAEALALPLTNGVLSLPVGPHRVVCLVAGRGEAAAEATHGERITPVTRAPVVLSSGWSLSIQGGAPFAVAVDVGWESQGYPSFAGTGIYRRPTELPSLAQGQAWHLVLPGVSGTAECWIDGNLVGRHIAGEARFPLPVSGRPVLIELRVRNTAANRYYPGTPFWKGAPEPSGLTAPPRLVAVSGGASLTVRERGER